MKYFNHHLKLIAILGLAVAPLFAPPKPPSGLGVASSRALSSFLQDAEVNEKKQKAAQEAALAKQRAAESIHLKKVMAHVKNSCRVFGMPSVPE